MVGVGKRRVLVKRLAKILSYTSSYKLSMAKEESIQRHTRVVISKAKHQNSQRATQDTQMLQNCKSGN